MYRKYARTIKNLDAFRAHLVAKGVVGAGVAQQGPDLYVHYQDKTANPDQHVAAYIEPDYFEITSPLPSRQTPTGPSFVAKAGMPSKFTITRRSGKDGSLKTDSSPAIVTWHGHEVEVTPSEIDFIRGPVEVVVGSIPKVSIGGWVFVDNAAGEHAHVFVAVE